MGIVTVSAPYGAAGAEIAPAVAERLGLPFHDRAIPAQVAGRLGVPVAEAEANDEVVVGGLWRLVASLGTMPDPVGGVLPTSTLPDARAYRQQTERVLSEIATSGGGVVLGRAGAMVLGERADALHVRLDGPADRRLAAAVARSAGRWTRCAARWRVRTGPGRPTCGTSTDATRRVRPTTTW